MDSKYYQEKPRQRVEPSLVGAVQAFALRPVLHSVHRCLNDVGHLRELLPNNLVALLDQCGRRQKLGLLLDGSESWALLQVDHVVEKIKLKISECVRVFWDVTVRDLPETLASTKTTYLRLFLM